MTTRQVDEAADRLRELRTQTVGDLALALAAFGLALTASRLHPPLAMPLLIGAIAVAFLGMRALVRRTFLVEDLALDRDTHVIPNVRDYALRAASPDHRRSLARSLRVAATASNESAGRLTGVRDELAQLIAVLEDDRVALEPQAAVALERWVDDPAGSFRDPSVPVAQLRSRLRTILAGFEPAGGSQ